NVENTPWTVVGQIVLRDTGRMPQRDLPPAVSKNSDGAKPSALPALQAERKKRQAAQARALAAEQEVAELQQRVHALVAENSKAVARSEAAWNAADTPRHSAQRHTLWRVRIRDPVQG